MGGDIGGSAADGRLDAESLGDQISSAIVEGGLHELVATAGQSAGLIHDLAGAADIIRRIGREAEVALSSTSGFNSR